MITLKRLKELLHYDLLTGVFTRARSLTNQVKAGDLAGNNRHNGYVAIYLDNKKYYAHRLAWFWFYGVMPDGEIDHINGDRTNNRGSNLRSVGRKENTKNKRMHGQNTSGVMGVSKTASGKWRVYIGVSGRQINLGVYEDFEVACLVRKEAEHKYNFHPNHGKAA